jgi:hypothetical protein
MHSRIFVSFLPVLAYDGANMTRIDAGGILDVDRRHLRNAAGPQVGECVAGERGQQYLAPHPGHPRSNGRRRTHRRLAYAGDHILETILNKSEQVKALERQAKSCTLTSPQKNSSPQKKREYKSKRKLIQEKPRSRYATRIPAFMYLTDFLRKNTLQDVITKLEPALFLTVTGLTDFQDFHLLVHLRVFNTGRDEPGSLCVSADHEDASLRYTGLESHPGLTHYGPYEHCQWRKSDCKFQVVSSCAFSVSVRHRCGSGLVVQAVLRTG